MPTLQFTVAYSRHCAAAQQLLLLPLRESDSAQQCDGPGRSSEASTCRQQIQKPVTKAQAPLSSSRPLASTFGVPELPIPCVPESQGRLTISMRAWLSPLRLSEPGLRGLRQRAAVERRVLRRYSWGSRRGIPVLIRRSAASISPPACAP